MRENDVHPVGIVTEVNVNKRVIRDDSTAVDGDRWSKRSMSSVLIGFASGLATFQARQTRGWDDVVEGRTGRQRDRETW